MVTSHDVARLAGVSQPTVSRALRDDPKIATATRARVRQAARALGYVPIATGRALSSGRSQRIGLLLTDLENQFYPHLIAPLHRELDALGYQLVLHTESTDSASIAERLISHALDGVLLATTTVDSVLPIRLRDRGLPVVYFNRVSTAVDADAVTVDPVPGMTELAAEVARLGHTDVAAISGPRNTSTGEQRETALRSALDVHGLTIPERSTHRGPFDFDTGFEACRRLLAADRRPSVIICGNDVIGFGALNAARSAGVSVPEELSVVGFDDLPTAGWPLVELATVGFDLEAMARSAARLMVERVDSSPDTPYRHEVFPSALVLRRSLGPAPHR